MKYTANDVYKNEELDVSANFVMIYGTKPVIKAKHLYQLWNSGSYVIGLYPQSWFHGHQVLLFNPDTKEVFVKTISKEDYLVWCDKIRFVCREDKKYDFEDNDTDKMTEQERKSTYIKEIKIAEELAEFRAAYRERHKKWWQFFKRNEN